MNIRKFKEEDLRQIQEWWVDSGEFPPLKGMLTPEITFILEDNNESLASVSVLFTNCKEFAYLMGLIKNPNIKEEFKKIAIPTLLEYVEKYTKENGYKRLLMYSYKDKLKKRYQELGYNPDYNNVTTFWKDL